MNPLVDKYRDWDAAYVLGSLSTDERREFERHLSACIACSSAVADLAGMPGMLMKMDATTAKALVQSPVDENVFALPLEPIQKLARAAIKRKSMLRRKMAAGMAVAASIVMVIGLAIGLNIGSSPTPASNQESAVAIGTKIAMIPLENYAMVVNMQVSKKKWGTQFAWNCVYGNYASPTQKSQFYDLVITDASGTATTIATWSQTGASAKGLVASTGIPLAKIKTVEVRYSDSHAPIVRGQV